MRAFFISLAALILCSTANAAPSTPQAAVQAYFADLQSNGLSAGADHMHPAELARFKSMLLPLFTQNAGEQPTDLRVAIFGSNATNASVTAMPPREFMRSFLGLVAKQPAMASLQIQSPELVGAVPEGDIVHVISRTRVGNGEMSVTQMEVISLKQDGEAWRLMLSGSIEGMAQALRQRPARKQ